MDFNEFAKQTNENANELLKNCYRYKKRKSEGGVPIYILIDKGLKHIMKFLLRKSEIDTEAVPVLQEMGNVDKDFNTNIYSYNLNLIPDITPACCYVINKIKVKGERATNKYYYICIINDGYFRSVKERKFVINHEIGHAVHDDLLNEDLDPSLPPNFSFNDGYPEAVQKLLGDRFIELFQNLRKEALADLYAYKETGVFLSAINLSAITTKCQQDIVKNYKDIFDKYAEGDAKDKFDSLCEKESETMKNFDEVELYLQFDLRKQALKYYQMNHTFDNFHYEAPDFFNQKIN